MQVVTADFVKHKKVLLRLDLDVSIEVGKVTEDFRLKASLSTLDLCLQNASQVIIMGHIGRPSFAEASEGKPQFSVAPIYNWLIDQGYEKFKLLENLRFESGEDACDLEYAKELASLGEVYVNEAFGAHHPASSTTILPTLLPHAAGLHFAEEVRKLGEVRNNPKHPLVVIIGGVKLEDKLPAIESMRKIADSVLIGGKIASEIGLSKNLTEDGLDINEETISEWKLILQNASQIVWNGPLGKEDHGTLEIAKAVIDSDAESIVGGGDTVAFLDRVGLLDKFSFVSVGGGAMLKFLTEGTLPTIEVLG